MQLSNILESTGGAKYSELYLEFKKHKSHVTFLKRVENSVLPFIPNATVSLSCQMEMDLILNRCIENALFRLIFCISVFFIKYLYSNFADNSYELYKI